MADGVHRDDLDADVAEEAVRALQEMYPGMKVVFAGDAPGGPPPEIQEKIDAIDKHMTDSLVKGQCFDCGLPIPNWPPPDDDSEDWKLSEGWSYYNAPNNTAPGFFICPKCQEETPSV